MIPANGKTNFMGGYIITFSGEETCKKNTGKKYHKNAQMNKSPQMYKINPYIAKFSKENRYLPRTIYEGV